MSIRPLLKGQLSTVKNVGKAWNITSVGAEDLDAGTLLVGVEPWRGTVEIRGANPEKAEDGITE